MGVVLVTHCTNDKHPPWHAAWEGTEGPGGRWVGGRRGRGEGEGREKGLADELRS